MLTHKERRLIRIAITPAAFALFADSPQRGTARATRCPSSGGRPRVARPLTRCGRSIQTRQCGPLENRQTQAIMARGGRRSTSFTAGKSGNPGGRPKRPRTIAERKIVADVKAAARC
jgi:hypothetical protein